MTVEVPREGAVLRFRPSMKTVGALAMPNDLDFVRYEIQAERDGKRAPLWQEDIPPIICVRGESGWWGDRIISVADLAGQNVTLHFAARHKDGRKAGPMAVGGFDRIALLALEQATK